MGEVQTAALWDGVEEPGELRWETVDLVWADESRYYARLLELWPEVVREMSGVGPQRRAWAVYARMEPWGA